MSATVKHGDIECTYNEQIDKWAATVDGKTTTSDKLSNLRKRIDQLLAPPKVRIDRPVYIEQRYGEGYIEGIVTAARIDDPDEFSIAGAGDCTRMGRFSIYERSDANTKRIERLRAIEKEIKALHTEKNKLKSAMQRANLPTGSER
jgi:hypothetical protein